MNGVQPFPYTPGDRCDRPSLPSVPNLFGDILHPTNSKEVDYHPQRQHGYLPSTQHMDKRWMDRSPYPTEPQSNSLRSIGGLQPDSVHRQPTTPLAPYPNTAHSVSSNAQPPPLPSSQHYAAPTAAPTHPDARSRPISNQSELQRPVSPVSNGLNHVESPASRNPSNRVPCYLGQEFRPGKGMCHIYDDGSTCKTTIAGEPVNPQWGVTKAGKPRKRLAQACTTCREKKIKCEPGFPKCAQCTKMDRPCIRSEFDHPPPDAGSTPLANKASIARPSEQALPQPTAENSVVRKREPSPEQPGYAQQAYASMPPPQPLVRGPGQNPKRYRQLSPDLAEPDLVPEAAQHGWSANPYSSHDMPVDFGATVDPYLMDPDLTMKFLELYFTYRDCGCYTLFPKEQFLSWVENNKQKSEDDLMLLYMMMAVGTMFGGQSDKLKGNKFANIARKAQHDRLGKFSIQLAHTRFFLMFYYFAKQKMADCWEFAGAACRVLSALRFNVDEGIEDISENCTEYAYGMNRVQIEDCRRRTFWIGYTIDRYISFCSNQVGAISDADTYLRLPLPEAKFYNGTDAPTDFFNGGDLESLGHEYGSTASLASVASIWGDVVATTYRFSHCKSKNYATMLDDFYNRTASRLESWEKSIAPHLRYSTANTEASLKNGNCCEYFVLHALHKVTGIALNRLGHYDRLPRHKVIRNIRQANVYARQLLLIAASMERVPEHDRPTDVNSALYQPFPGYAVQIACDVVSRGGAGMEDLTSAIKLLAAAASALEQIGRIWVEARLQQERVNGRLIEMTTRAMETPTDPSSTKPWALPHPMQGSFHRTEHDLVHNTPADVYIEALQGLVIPETRSPRR